MGPITIVEAETRLPVGIFKPGIHGKRARLLVEFQHEKSVHVVSGHDQTLRLLVPPSPMRPKLVLVEQSESDNVPRWLGHRRTIRETRERVLIWGYWSRRPLCARYRT